MNHTPEVKVHGKEMLAELGPLSTQEKKVAVGFILALLGWGTAIITGFNANAIRYRPGRVPDGDYGP